MKISYKQWMTNNVDTDKGKWKRNKNKYFVAFVRTLRLVLEQLQIKSWESFSNSAIFVLTTTFLSHTGNTKVKS